MGSHLSYCTLIFDLMRNFYLYEAYIYTYIHYMWCDFMCVLNVYCLYIVSFENLSLAKHQRLLALYLYICHCIVLKCYVLLV